MSDLNDMLAAVLLRRSIWWLWTAYPSGHPSYVHLFECDPESDDLAWLGEGGWSFRGDTMGLGLVSL